MGRLFEVGWASHLLRYRESVRTEATELVSQHRTASSEDQFLMAEVAQLYYVKDFTQEQIAQRIGVSRSNVSRMLKAAGYRG